MAEDRSQLVDEQTMEKMSVAPPDPRTASLGSHGNGSAEREELQDTSGSKASGVDDRDPLSAHPS